MSEFIKDNLDRFFKFYFILCLLGFTLLVLLMNIPQVLASDVPQVQAATLWQARATPKFPQEKLQLLPSKLYRWQLPVSQKPTDPDYFMEMRMNRMMFRMKF